MDGYEVVLEVQLTDQHEATGEKEHFDGDRLLPPPAALRIVRDGEHDGFTLLYLNADGDAQASSWHETIDAAKHQATFEFGVANAHWRVP